MFTGAPSFDVDTVYDITDTGGSNTFATCRVRSIERNGSQYRLYVYDIQFAGSYTSLTGATTITSGAFSFTIDTTDGVGLYDPQYNKSIYKLPADFIKSVKNQSEEIEFTARKVFTPQSPTATTVVLQLTSPDRFEEFGTDSYIIIDASGNIKAVSQAVRNEETNNNQVTLTSSGIDTNGTVSVIASYRTSLTKKAKALTSITDEVLSGDNTTVNTNTEIELANHDIIAITSAQDFAGNNIDKELFILDNGQRDGCYKK